MRSPHFCDMVEIRPGVWAAPGEAAAKAAEQPTIADHNKGRPHTIDDIPVIGTPGEFLAVVACLAAVAWVLG